MGERTVRIRKVMGSNPTISTKQGRGAAHGTSSLFGGGSKRGFEPIEFSRRRRENSQFTPSAIVSPCSLSGVNWRVARPVDGTRVESHHLHHKRNAICLSRQIAFLCSAKKVYGVGFELYESVIKGIQKRGSDVRFDVAHLLSQVYRTFLDEIDK